MEREGRGIYGVFSTILLIVEISKRVALRMCEDRFLEGYEGHGLGV